MSNTITVTIVTPFGTQEQYHVNHLRAPGLEGEFGVLPGHIPFMTILRIGAIHLDTAKGPVTWAMSGGYAEVLPDNVTILAETAELADNIDLKRAQAAHDRALARIDQHTPDIDMARAKASLFRAINRMKIVTELNSDSR